MNLFSFTAVCKGLINHIYSLSPCNNQTGPRYSHIYTNIMGR